MEREQVEERERLGTERTWDTCCPAKQTTARRARLFGPVWPSRVSRRPRLAPVSASSIV